MKNQYFMAKDGYEADDLVRYGRDHMLSSQALFETNNPDYLDSAGYLAHMGVELLVKGWALYRNGQFLKDHRIRILIQDIGLISLRFSKPMKEAIDLADSFETLKYPKPHAPQGIGQEDWETMERLWIYIFNKMPVQLKRRARTLSRCRKGKRVLFKRPNQTK